MEFVGFDPGVIHANVHTKTYNHSINTGKGDKISIPDASKAFHVYAIEWDAKQMDFLVDHKKYFTFKNEGTGHAAWPYDKEQYLILNLAIGGGWGGQKGIDDCHLSAEIRDRLRSRVSEDRIEALRQGAETMPSTPIRSCPCANPRFPGRIVGGLTWVVVLVSCALAIPVRLRPQTQGGRRPASQHRLHLLRRPRLSGHQRLWRLAAADRDAQHRPAGQGGDAVRPLPGAQLDLRAQPRHGAHRQVQPRERLLQQHQQPFRWLADDVPQAASGRGLSDGHLRQVAPGQRADRLRRLAHLAGPGRLLQPADARRRRQGSASRATSPTSSPSSRSTGSRSETGRSPSC